MSIGTVNSVWATAAGERNRPAVRVRRTALSFDGAGNPHIGDIPRFSPVCTDFADLATDPAPVEIHGRIWSPADLVAAVVNGLIATRAPEAPAVTAYPAYYSDKHVTRLRRALDWSGAADVTLMPEPVAAVEWLDAEYGVCGSGITLVYDLGGNSLDVAVVRTEADRQERGILGRPERSAEYGGRPLGTLLARYARSIAPGETRPVSAVVPSADTSRLRTWHIRNSLHVVRSCVHSTGLDLQDIDRILLIGGAARPVEVGRVLADLGRPIVMSPDPAHTVAVGAALAAARSSDPGSALARYTPSATVLSGAAVASAFALSAAAVLGGPVAGPPNPQSAPDPSAPPTAAPGLGDILVLEDADATPGTRAHAITALTALRSYVPSAQTVTPTWSHGHPVDRTGGGSHCETRIVTDIPLTYGNPAQFTNPLPFPVGTLAGYYSRIFPSPTTPGTGTSPGSPGTGQPGGSTPGEGQPGDPGTGATPGDPGGTPDGGKPSGGTTPGGATGGGATGGVSSGGASGGGATGGGAAGSGAENGGSTGGATGGGASGGGSGGANGGGANAGGSGGATGGASDGGSAGGSANGDGSAGGDAGEGSTGGGTKGDGSAGGDATGGGAAGGDSAGGASGGGSGGGGDSSAGGTGGGDSSGGETSGGGSGGAPGGDSSGGSTGGGASGAGAGTGHGTAGGDSSGRGSAGGGATGAGATGAGASPGGGAPAGGKAPSGGGTPGGVTPGGGKTGGVAPGGGLGGGSRGGVSGGGLGGGGLGAGGGHGGGLGGGGLGGGGLGGGGLGGGGLGHH